MAHHNINVRRQTKGHVTIAAPGSDNLPQIAPAPIFSNPWKSAISVSNVSKLSAFVDELEDRLVEHIVAYANNSLVVGCVAWLSNPRIINALALHSKGVLLLVNDENYAVWGSGKCMDLYAQLPAVKDNFSTLFDHMETPLRGLPSDATYNPVRCIRNTGDALMHDKFLVFFKPVGFDRDGTVVWRDVPYAVWTGSMNMTKKASRNQENAVYVESELLAKFYFNNFVNSFLRSAPLRVTGGGSGGTVNEDKPFGYVSSNIPPQFRPFIKTTVKRYRPYSNKGKKPTVKKTSLKQSKKRK